MCGIAGILGPGWKPQQLYAMVDVQKHRGPDGHGYWMDEQVALGHNRLAIFDTSEAGAQPMESTDHNLHIVFNGAIYNHEELRAEISDYEFRTRTDTEIILAAYQRWGADCVNHLNGMFAFAIWDSRERELFCARDRLGQKPFYYACLGDNFVFASEIKALLAAGVVPKVNPAMMADYVSFGFVDHTDETLFSGISSLPPGHHCTLIEGPHTRSAESHTACYWSLPEQLQGHDCILAREGDRYVADLLERLLEDSVRLRLRADVPVVLNYSGGLDSSALKRFAPDTAFGTMQLAFAKGSARTVEELQAAIWHLEAPLGSLETLFYYTHHRSVSDQGFKVALDGNGADEILAGYPWYHFALLEHYDWYRLQPAKDYRPDWALVQAGPRPSSPKPFDSELTNAMYRDLRYIKLPKVLRMNDRLSMAHGVELRSPFMDHRLVEFCFSLPDEMKVRDGHGKWLLRYAMDYWKPKTTRSDDLKWLTGPLRPFVEELIHSPEFAQRGLFDAKKVQDEYARLCEQGGSWFPIWQWVNVELWYRTFIDGGKA